MIYHIVLPTHWEKFEGKETYFSETFDTEGFIHCSTAEQVAGVLERYYKGADKVLKLHIDETKLISQPIYEKATNNELFPHIFGGINTDAVVEIEEVVNL